MILLLACADPIEAPPEVAPITAPAVVEETPRPPERPRFDQDELRGLETTATFRGELRCPVPGPFQLRVYPPANDDRLYYSFPLSGFLVSLDLADGGPFEILVPKGSGRLLLAWRDGDGDGWPSMEEAPFFADPHGQPWEVNEDRDGLVLDCTLPPAEPDRPQEPRAPASRQGTTMKAIQDETGPPMDLETRLGGGPQ